MSVIAYVPEDARGIFPLDSLEWVIYLTRQEWQTVYACSFMLLADGMIPSGTFGSVFRHTVRHLVEEYGAELQAVRVTPGGCLYTEEDEPVEEHNAAFHALIRRGHPPDLEVHVPAARKWLEEHCHDFPMDAFRDFESQVMHAASKARAFAKEIPQETKDAFRDGMRRRIEATQEGVN